MKGRRSLFILLALGAVGVLFGSASASGQTGRISDANNVQAAAGSFSQDLRPLGVNDRRLFAFDVIQRGSGVVGQAQQHSPLTSSDSQLTVTCYVQHGNQALVGATVTQSTDPTRVGVTGVFAIQDDPDQVTFFINNNDSSFNCSNALALTGEPSITAYLAAFSVPGQTAVVTIGAPGD
jgi:hypothetical protein